MLFFVFWIKYSHEREDLDRFTLETNATSRQERSKEYIDQALLTRQIPSKEALQALFREFPTESVKLSPAERAESAFLKATKSIRKQALHAKVNYIQAIRRGRKQLFASKGFRGAEPTKKVVVEQQNEEMGYNNNNSEYISEGGGEIAIETDDTSRPMLIENIDHLDHNIDDL